MCLGRPRCPGLKRVRGTRVAGQRQRPRPESRRPARLLRSAPATVLAIEPNKCAASHCTRDSAVRRGLICRLRDFAFV